MSQYPARAAGPLSPEGMGPTARRMTAWVLLLFLGFFCAMGAALAQEAGSPRGAQHDGFGRLAFDWDGPVAYSADIVNGQLVVRFNRPVAGDFRGVLGPLSRYLADVAVSADRQTATFPLKIPVQVKSYTNALGGVVVDLIDQPAASPAPDSHAGPAPAAPVSLLPQASQEKNGKAGTLDIRVGEHGGYKRLVFSWPAPVSYRVDQGEGKASVIFAGKAAIDVAALKAELGDDIPVLSAGETADGTELLLGLPQNARIRHYASGPKIVVDVVRAATRQAGENAPPATVMDARDPAPPTLKPLQSDNAAPRLPSEALPHPSGKNEPPPPAKAPVPAVTSKPVDAAHDTQDSYSLNFSWDRPVAAAVFNRAGYLWLVFDRHQKVDTAFVKRQGGDALIQVEQFDQREATVLRLIVQPDFYPSVRRDGLLWVVDLSRTPSEPPHPIAVTAPAALATGTGIVLSVADAGGLVRQRDPDVGDTMVVVPVIPVGAGVSPGRDTPDVAVLATVQGIALVPRLDGLDIKTSRSGVTIAPAGGGEMHLTGGASTAASNPAGAAREEPPAALFDVPAWMRGGLENFAQNRETLDRELADVPPARRAQAHLAAARLFFANGFGAEALGYLTLAAQESPALADTAPFRALRGAANVLMRRGDRAVFDLDSAQVKQDEEARFWAAVARADSGAAPASVIADLARGLPVVRNYSKGLQAPLAETVARTAIAAGDDDAAQAALGVLIRLNGSPAAQGWLDYLRGAYAQLKGNYPNAVQFYEKAQAGANREARARAGLAETELLYNLKKITAAEAVERLDRLRFAWREEMFEFGLLKRLAELQTEAGHFADALRSLRALVDYYPDNEGTPALVTRMHDLFKALYLDGAADSLPPVSAIALYDEFRDLTPTGAQGDEMVRKLADRLVTVDLLGRAADLLRHQVDYRLKGLDKVRVGTQLAVLSLLDKKPRAALEALAASDAAGIPDELALQRRQLRANALAALGRESEAIALLKGDDSVAAALLRAEIYWRGQDWANAARAFEALVPRPAGGARLDDASARLVLNWATALVLANDEYALAALRRSFTPSMAGTPYEDGFRFLTGALDHGLPDMKAVVGKVRDAEGFRTFLGDYKTRLQKGGVSAIN